MLLVWNARHKDRIDWAPTEKDLRLIFYGGTGSEKQWVAYQSMNVLDGRLSYPEAVLRAVRLMLEAYEKGRVENPVAWIYACLHGNGDGRGPWVHLRTALEESG